MEVQLPSELVGISPAKKQEYVAHLQNEVSELQATLEDVRRTAPRNMLSEKFGAALLPYPPLVRFRTLKTMRCNDKSRVMRMTAFKPNGHTQLASIHQNGMVVLWDSASGLKYEAFLAGKGNSMGLAVNPNGSVMAAGGLSCSVELYEIGAKLRELTNEALPEESTGFPSRKRDSISSLANQHKYTLGNHNSAVSALSFIDGKTLASGELGGRVQVWDVNAATSIFELSESSSITAIATRPLDSLLGTATENGTLRLTDMREEANLAQLIPCSDSLSGLKFMPDGYSVLTSSNTVMQLHDMRSCAVLETYNFRGGSITAFDISSSGRMAVVGSESGGLFALDLLHNRWFPPVDSRKGRVSGAAIVDGTVICSSWDGSIRTYQYEQ